MTRTLSDSAVRRRHLRRGIVCLSLSTLCGVSLLIGWIVAEGDPTVHVSGRGYGLPLWLSSIWIGAFGVALLGFGISQMRIAALFRDSGDDSTEGRR